VTTTLVQRPDPEEAQARYDELIRDLERQRDELDAEEGGTFFNRPMSEPELIEYLCFQAYYEKRAAEFIGRWLADTPERDAFVMLAQQVEDEANHYEYCMRALARRGVTSLDGWTPEPEWEEWLDVWYPSGTDTIERVAAHNVTGESGACQAFLEVRPRLPGDVQKIFDRIIPDEQFHLHLGKQVLVTYCRDDEDWERVRGRAQRTFELEQAGRIAYNRRMARLGLGDVDDPSPLL
jgi:rubrerythrin